MTTREQVIEYCLTFSGVFEDYPFRDPGWTCMRIRKTNRIFAWIYERQGHIWVNVKCDPQWRDFWRKTYTSVLPGYHMNKEHWSTVIVGGDADQRQIMQMINDSYNLTAKKGKKK